VQCYHPMRPILKWAGAGLGLALAAGVATEVLGSRGFTRLVQGDVRALLDQALGPEASASPVSAEMLAPLPDPVRRYLAWTGVVGQPIPRMVRLRQRGRMRLGRGQPWWPLDAVQHYSVRPPGFVWVGTLGCGPLRLARARDMYQGGRGRMLVRLGSHFSVVDAEGKEMDQGAMTRYLSEMVWFPAALLGANVSFEAVDGSSARVILNDHGHTVAGTLHVDANGRPTDFVTARQRMQGETSRLATWSTPMTAYGTLAGLRLPVEGRAVWKLAGGDLEYFEVRVTELTYDPGPGVAACE